MPTNTTNLSLNKPLVNDPTDADLWGGYLNSNADILDSEAVLATVNKSWADKIQSGMALKDTSEVVYSLGNISGAVAIDYTNGQYQRGILTGNITSLTISNWPTTTTNAGWLLLDLIQDGTGGRTLALGSAYKFQGGTAPVLSTGANAMDTLTMRTPDGGTNIYLSATLNWS